MSYSRILFGVVGLVKILPANPINLFYITSNHYLWNMTTLKIKVSDKMLDKLLGMLKQFKTEDVQIVQEFETLDEEQNYVHESLAKLESGESRSFSIQELDERMERIIKDYED